MPRPTLSLIAKTACWLIVLGTCAPTHKGVKKSTNSYTIAGERYYVLDSAQGFVQQGLASWYGRDFHGRPTASGEIYDMYANTAAHKTLPLGTYLQIHNLNNGQRIVVRVNDRGPFVKGRIIDVSYAVARDLGLLEAGVMPVKIEALGKATTDDYDFNQGSFTIQVGAFQEKANAQKLANDFTDSHITLYDSPKGRFHRVRVGNFSSLAEAVKACGELESEKFDDAFVVAE
jgi:rare lipoprotein A